MTRKLLALSVSAGMAASVPLLYQANPNLFHDIAAVGLTQITPAPEEERPIPVVNLAAVPSQKQLTGRRVELTMGSRGHFTGEFKINGRRVDAMIDPGVAPWDVCGPAVIVREAGGRFTNFEGEDTIHDGTGFLASNGAVHDQLLDLLRKE